MRTPKIFFLSLIGLTILSGCAAPLSKSQRNTIQNVAVINEFPRYPNYALIGTAVFNNEYDELKDSAFRKSVTGVVVEYLEKKGYSTAILDKAENQNAKEYDLVLTLIPRDVYGMSGTLGYGVNQRSFLGSTRKPLVYMALNIRPEINGSAIGNAYYNQALSNLSFDLLPEKSTLMSEAQRKEVHKKLNESIEKAISELLVKVGL